MTIWKRERNHFNYYVTNERKQPHIYVEALGTPSASTEKVLKDHGFKFDHNKCMYAAAQTNDLRLFVAHVTSFSTMIFKYISILKLKKNFSRLISKK